MKKSLLFLLTLCLALSCLGQALAIGPFTPGTYRAADQGMFSEIEVMLTVDKNAITAIEIAGANETPGLGQSAMEFMREAYIGKSDADDVDIYTGATVTSIGIINAVSKALENAAAGAPAWDSKVRLYPGNDRLDGYLYKEKGSLLHPTSLSIRFKVEGASLSAVPAVEVRWDGDPLPIQIEFTNWYTISGENMEVFGEMPYMLSFSISDADLLDSEAKDYPCVIVLTFPNQTDTIPYTFHVVNSLPALPVSLEGFPANIVIPVGEEVAFTPHFLPEGWDLGVSAGESFFYFHDQPNNAYPVLNADDVYEVFREENGESTLALRYAFSGDTCSLEGLVPGAYTGFYSWYVTNANLAFQQNTVLTVAEPQEHGVSIDAAHFPDDAFRAYVQENFDADGSGVLSDAEISAVQTVSVPNMGIETLQGIEYFTGLTHLDCEMNSIPALNLSGNPALATVNCASNWMDSLDVSKCTALEELACQSNCLASLDVSQSPALKTLGCSMNHLTALNVSNNPALATLDVVSNQLGSLDVSRNPALETLLCKNNQLETLDITQNTNLKTLNCDNNQLTRLAVGQNEALGMLSCKNNRLTSLDLAFCGKLGGLICHGNQLPVTAEGGVFDLNTLPGFDASKASDWQGATATGNTLTVPASGEVTYTYACGNGHDAAFSLNVTVTEKPDEDPVNKPGNVTGDGKGSVNGADVLRLARFLSGDDVQVNMKAADVTGDGKVDGRDLLRLCRYLAGDNVQLKVSPLN